jgi:hypothetical protein
MTTTILTDPHHSKADARMIAMAIKRGWTIPDSVLESLPKVLAGLVVKSADERTKVAAAKVLVSMHGQNQRDSEGPKTGPTINVGVQVDARSDDRRTRTLEIAERIRTRRISGDGRAE